MYDQLKEVCRQTVPITGAELALIDDHFELLQLAKKELLLREGARCDFLAFIASGSVRHFHTKDGLEKTCDISLESAWVTDFGAFNSGAPARMNLQAMEDTTVFLIRKPQLDALYKACGAYAIYRIRNLVIVRHQDFTVQQVQQTGLIAALKHCVSALRIIGNMIVEPADEPAAFPQAAQRIV